jgi:hypothetical protein
MRPAHGGSRKIDPGWAGSEWWLAPKDSDSAKAIVRIEVRAPTGGGR